MCRKESADVYTSFIQITGDDWELFRFLIVIE